MMKIFPATKHPEAIPESILLINPLTSTPETDNDSVTAIAERTHALAELLINYLHDREDLKRGGTPPAELNETTLLNYLWQISGNMEVVLQIVSTAFERYRIAKANE